MSGSRKLTARESLAFYDAGRLADSELVAIALGIKTSKAHEIIDKSGGVGNLHSPVGGTDLQRCKLRACLELGRRTMLASLDTNVIVRGPDSVSEMLIAYYAKVQQEIFIVLVLDARNRLKEIVEVGRGTIDACALHPRDVFRPVIKVNASSLIIAHNHPSGDTRASDEDIALTKRLREAATCLGLSLHDHLIVAGREVVSMRGLGYW